MTVPVLYKYSPSPEIPRWPTRRRSPTKPVGGMVGTGQDPQTVPVLASLRLATPHQPNEGASLTMTMPQGCIRFGGRRKTRGDVLMWDNKSTEGT